MWSCPLYAEFRIEDVHREEEVLPRRDPPTPARAAYYEPETGTIVGEAFERDLEHFGYEF